MADKSLIEWTDATWNTVYGCTHVSSGCKNCYAERLAPKMGVDFSNITLRPDRLDIPIRWKKPRMIFVNSLSDLFHPDVPMGFVMQVFAVMAKASRHTFQVLTKRPEQAKKMLLADGVMNWINDIAVKDHGCVVIPTQRHGMVPGAWPLPNVWLGVSVEDQATADERIPLLLQTPAAVRFVSYEPALGPVDFSKWLGSMRLNEGKQQFFVGLTWLICGGESGPSARPMHPDWARAVRDQCQAAGVAFHFKQWGEWAVDDRNDTDQHKYEFRSVRPVAHARTGDNWPDNVWMIRVGKKAAGRLLDGKEWSEFPR